MNYLALSPGRSTTWPTHEWGDALTEVQGGNSETPVRSWMLLGKENRKGHIPREVNPNFTGLLQGQKGSQRTMEKWLSAHPVIHPEGGLNKDHSDIHGSFHTPFLVRCYYRMCCPEACTEDEEDMGSRTECETIQKRRVSLAEVRGETQCRRWQVERYIQEKTETINWISDMFGHVSKQ